MKYLTLIGCMIILSELNAQPSVWPPTPDKLYGDLFSTVQLAKIYPDSKTFADAVPRRKVADIMYDYGLQKGSGMNLKQFVEANFDFPVAPQLNYIRPEPSATAHINNLWGTLTRNADQSVPGSSLLPLPAPYVVPGGRFQEIYYWDSYFTMLGLAESGQMQMIQNMVDNFTYLINTYGHIPNGNRTYYLSRSQPPFYALMIQLLAGLKGKQIYAKYLPALQKEYDYWMQGSAKVPKGSTQLRVVRLKDGSLLNRYWDEEAAPRQESYDKDVELAQREADELAMRIRVGSPELLKKILEDEKRKVYQHLRAGACSGWDFSSRWLADQSSLHLIMTADIVPVDLNCLMVQLEQTLAMAYAASGNQKARLQFEKLAAARKKVILKKCYDSKSGYFYDFVTDGEIQVPIVTAAGMFPLFIKIATPAQAQASIQTLKKELLKPGGIVTTTNHSGQQWDAPNGWAPLQWICAKGLINYQQKELAIDICSRWTKLNEQVYANTGKMMEKYNVEDLSQLAGGGEYPSQDGFGWTNGVYLAMKKLLSK